LVRALEAAAYVFVIIVIVIITTVVCQVSLFVSSETPEN